MAWHDNISGCFGSVDMLFALHDSDRQRAQEVLRLAMQEGVYFHDYIETFKAHMRSRGCPEQHIANQIVNISNVRYYLK